MIYIITGPSHTGKTKLSQFLLEKYKYPYLSIDHLKMGLIRSKNTSLTPLSPDRELTSLLWPIVVGIIKTAIENNQNLIVEGCYVPYDYKSYFSTTELSQIKYLCLIFSESYLKNHFDLIKLHENDIEYRGENCDDYQLFPQIDENKLALTKCRFYKNDYFLIDKRYPDYSLDLDL